MNRHTLRGRFFLALTGSLAIAACGGGGGGGGTPPPPPDPLLSSVSANPRFGTPADGVAAVELVAVIADASGNPLPGRTVVFEAAGFGNALVQPPRTDATGTTRGELRSLVGEKKSITAVVDPGPGEVRLGPVTAEFLRILPDWYFVRATGSDAADGRTPLTAWRTVSFALTRVGAGDTLFVGAGTYGGALTITTQASAEQPLEIRGDRLGEFTGDAGEVLIDAGAASSGIELAGAEHVWLRGLSVRGAAPGVNPGAGIRVAGALDCAVLDCRVYENERGITLVSSSGTVMEDCRVSANSGEGVRVFGGSDTSVRHNLVYANTGYGLVVASPTTNLVLESNTFYQNGGDQLRELAAGSTGRIANNILSEGGGMGLAFAAGSSLSQTNNLSWAQTGDSPPPFVEADPLFLEPFGADGILGGVGVEDDDFRVELSSPALDSGQGNAREQVLFFRGALGALSSRADSLPDGTPSDLAPVNLGFHYPLPLDEFGSLSPLGARAAFARMDDVHVWTRGTDAAASLWAAELATQALNADVRWLVHRVNPTLQPEELVAAMADTGAGTQLFLRAWDGRRWSDELPAVMTTVIPAANADERGFDLEYEALSGDALFVRSNADENPLFRARSNGRWSVEAPVFAPALNTGSVLWIELVPRPGTDEIAVVALDDEQKLAAAVWDGQQWTLPFLLATQVGALHDWKCFDAAWEATSGDLLVSWAYNLIIEETRFATLTRATSTWLTGQHNSTDAQGLMLSLAADPSSNRVAAIFGEGDVDDDIGVSVWNGSQWTHTAEFSLTGQAQSRAMEVGWFGDTGMAFAIYRDQSLTGVFQWALLRSAGWRLQPEVAFPGMGMIVQAEARNVPGVDRVVMLLLDENGALFALEGTTAGWTAKNGGAPLATGLDPANKGRSFDLDFRRL